MEEFEITETNLSNVRWIEFYMHEDENFHDDGTFYLEFHGDYGTIGYLDDVDIDDNDLPESMISELKKYIGLNKTEGSFNWEMDLSPKNPEDVNEVNKLAKMRFGTTYNFSFSGYLLVDGTMLNFSENGHNRTIDHRSIGIIGGIDMGKFMKLGNIRTLPESGGICLIKEPTSEQYRVLLRYFGQYFKKFSYVIVEIMNENMQSLDYYEYEDEEGWSPSLVVDDIKKYFRGGKKLGNGNNFYDSEDIRNFLEENKKRVIIITESQLKEIIK